MSNCTTCESVAASTPSSAAFSRSGTMRSSGRPSLRLLSRSTKPPRVRSAAMNLSAAASRSASARLPRSATSNCAPPPPCMEEGSMILMFWPGMPPSTSRASEMTCCTVRLRWRIGFSVAKKMPWFARGTPSRPPMPTASNSPTTSGCAMMYFSLRSSISVVAAIDVPGGVSKFEKNMLRSVIGNISLPRLRAGARGDRQRQRARFRAWSTGGPATSRARARSRPRSSRSRPRDSGRRRRARAPSARACAKRASA